MGALKAFIECTHCKCRSPNAPDDMALGGWFGSLGVPIIHEEGFHQSEPSNYHPDLLKYSDPVISFHRYGPWGRSGPNTDEKKLMQARRDAWGEWKKKYFNDLPAKK